MVKDVMRSSRSPSDGEDSEWRRLRRANSIRLLLFPLIVALFGLGWLVLTIGTQDQADGR